ncbi:Putative methyltransferase NSUN5 [Habropoda laboriosa]|uniref:Putative methyltransferase NSUN5 n=1 Tax=Habropoda laboriosa TaxID=597456 RepID=A0A0L7QUD6_9HYME|nr:Putative methyltransferase NSUN5 [Habropoda laboriosa]
MSSVFVHSIKVPRLYKTAAKIVREVRENGGSLKSLLYKQKHPNVSAIFALCFNTLQKEVQLDHLIDKTNLLKNEPRLDVWLAKVLITELLWGKKALESYCKPIKTILSYEKCLRKELNNIDKETLQTFNKTDMSFVAVLGKLFIYSIAMFTLPFGVFYGVQHIMKAEFHVDRFVINCVSVFAAVITVNVIIACYVYQALHEPDNVAEIKAIADQPSKDIKKARYTRINTLLLQLKDGISYFQEEGWILLPRCSSYERHLSVVKSLKKPNYIQDFHIPELFVFPADTSFYDYSGYQNGEIILQDKASCLPSFLLNPKPGSVVLDMCAAPGMKLSHLAAIMKNSGKVYAAEIDQQRFSTLCKHVEVIGATCVETINKDALTLRANEFPDIEYILVDPSCSGSGMLDRKLVPNEQKCAPNRLKQLQSFQVFLLRHALLNFPKVKKVVYSTCSIYPEENEQVVDEVLENVQNAYKLVPVRELLKEEWLNFSSKTYNCSDKCLYAISDVDLCNGFFVAVFERNFDVSLPKFNKIGSATVKKEQKEEETKKNEKSNGKMNITRKRKKCGNGKQAIKNGKVSSKSKGNNKAVQKNNGKPALKRKKM